MLYTFHDVHVLNTTLSSYCDLERSSIHDNLFSKVKVIHSVEEIIFRGWLVDAMTTNQCPYRECAIKY